MEATPEEPERPERPVPTRAEAAPARDGAAGGEGVPSSAPARALSLDERRQVAVERELLASMATGPDAFRPLADRLGACTWTDPRHEAMAWAMLATPEGTAPREVVAAAEAVVPEARVILSGGELSGAVGDTARRAAFLVDQVELFSTRRRIRSIKARLQSASDQASAEGLFREATELQRRVNELGAKLSDGFESVRNG